MNLGQVHACLSIARGQTPKKEAMTNLDSVLKSRDITLSTKVRIVKAMVFPVVMYGPKIRLSTDELMLSNCGVE